MAYFRCISSEVRQHFSWKTWVREGGLNATTYNSLDDVLEDEVALRRLFLVHASVDYMAFFEESNEDVQKIINCDLAAKWINLSDYALDILYANIIIKHYMDVADKYFYGEWALMPQVPTMTSNTAPYGTVIYSSQQTNQEAYKAFDSVVPDITSSNNTWYSNNLTNGYIGYNFIQPIIVKMVKFRARRASSASITCKNYIIQGSNDNSTWENLKSSVYPTTTEDFVVEELSNENAYSYYRLFIEDTYGGNYAAIQALQFYSWQPKGNVPVMTSDTAPYGTASASREYTSSGITFSAYYAFTDLSARGWCNGRANTTDYIQYAFVNPVNVRKLKLKTGNGTSGIVKTFTLSGSNDGATFTDIQTFTGYNDTNIHYFEVTNSNYYMYYRVTVTALYIATDYDWIMLLQFYGRELSVSVPVMTGDTTPYGTVNHSNVSGNYNAWYAFNGDFSKTSISASSTSGVFFSTSSKGEGYIGYDFGKKVKLKKVLAKLIQPSGYASGSKTIVYHYEYSDDGTTWHEIESSSNSVAIANTSSNFVFSALQVFDCNIVARYFRCHDESTSTTTFGMAVINFFCEDYSEKEFEAGTTKKWLYDHGVELVDLGSPIVENDGSARRNADSLFLEVNSTSSSGGGSAAFMPTEAIDFTDYNVMRIHAGTQQYNSYNNTSGTTLPFGIKATRTYSRANNDYARIAGAGFGITNNPYSKGLDISSVNESAYALVSENAGQTTVDVYGSITEWWLE